MQSRDPNLGRASRVQLRLETLEDRTCPTLISIRGTTLTITGNATENTVVVRDQGNGNVSAAVETAKGKVVDTLSARGVSTISINSIKTNEVVDYTLTGPQDTKAAHTLDISTGAGKNEVDLNLAKGVVNSTLNVNLHTGTGSDVIDAVFGAVANSHVNVNELLGTGREVANVQVQGAITGDSVFQVNEKGGSGVDALAFAMNGTIAAKAAVSVNLTGGTHADTLNTSYSGLLDGKLSLVTRDGSGGDKATSTVAVAGKSTGTLTDSLIAGTGGDVLALNLQDTAHLQAVSAAIQGRSGLDVGIVSQRIQVHTPGATGGDRLAGSGIQTLDISWNGTVVRLTAAVVSETTPVPSAQPAASAAYSAVQGTLFNPETNVPAYQDIQQNQLGDCWLLATLAEVAVRDPSAIEQMFHYDGTAVESGATVDIYTVRFYDKAGTPVDVVVDTELPAGGGLYATPVNGVLWPALAEKAYVEANGHGWVTTNQEGDNSYSALNSGAAAWALQAITGSAPAYNPVNGNAMASAWESGQLVELGTADFGNSTPAINGASIAPDHVYAVVGYNPSTQVFTLFNPWGVAGGQYTMPNGQPSPFCAGMVTATAAQLASCFSYQAIGNA